MSNIFLEIFHFYFIILHISTAKLSKNALKYAFSGILSVHVITDMFIRDIRIAAAQGKAKPLA